ncbi:helix-turn-helix domain-containing protein [Fodinicurvata fenggangensis]|uniref:helix-turn-helix domain-containing protein n=1 Tax=Fodinicurvata fenggangensis TaxID=1121830 RepID=UPI00069253F1|nr:helix-turn-helix transcriptional regulator [Fodinicurvata fenggangensis]
MSYRLAITPKRRKVIRFIGGVRDALVNAYLDEKKENGVTKQELADRVGVNKSVITRRLNGSANLTLRSIAEMADALGRDIEFRLVKDTEQPRPSWVRLGNQPETESTDDPGLTRFSFQGEVSGGPARVKPLEPAEP